MSFGHAFGNSLPLLLFFTASFETGTVCSKEEVFFVFLPSTIYIKHWRGGKEYKRHMLNFLFAVSIHSFTLLIFYLQKSYVCTVESVDADNLVIDLNKDLIALEDIVATNLAPHKFK